MLLDFVNGQTSVVLRVKLTNSSVTTGAGLTGLTSASSGLIISTITDVEATATAYAVAASNVETVTTLGTYAAPTAGKCRFREVDATNHPGLYELQLADARFAVSNAKELTITLTGATNLAQCDLKIPLRTVNPYVSGGIAPVDLQTIKTQTVTCAAGVTVLASVGTAATSTAQTGDSFARIGAAGAGLTAVALTAAGLDSVVVETGVNARQALSPILAACAGVLSGAGTGAITIKGGNVATTRIVATTDTAGNRSAITLSLPT